MKRMLLLVLVVRAFGAAPVVTKVEPPDWVAEPHGITLRLLLTGSGLASAKVQAAFPADSLLASASGTHLFLDLKIPAQAQPGNYPLRITTAEGSTDVPFSLVAPLAARQRFQGFSPDDVIYLIMPDRFANGDPSNDDPPAARGMFDRTKPRYYHGGDFAGVIRHLPYLKDLGVTAIWLTPISDNADFLNEREKYENQAIADYHGYGAVDFYAVEQHFGTLRKYRELVDAAHALGIKVIQDQVANHTGPYHPWVQDPPTPTWFHGSEARHLANTWRIWTLIDPHASPALSRSTLDGWFAGILPDLNQDDPEVARYLIQNTLWWIDRTGIDGIREDTIPYVPRRFWRDWNAAIHERYPAFRVVGEVFDPGPALVSFFQGGAARFDGIDSGFDTVFDFPLAFTLRKVFRGAAPMTEISKILARDSLYPDPGRLVTFIDLHDLPRFLHEPGASPEALEQIFTFLLTARGIPMLYYGDEIGMTGGDDPDNRRDFPGGWREDTRNAFEPSGRDWAAQALHRRFQKLANLRAASEALRRGAFIELLVEDEAYAFARVLAGRAAVVVFNHSASTANLRIPLEGAGIADDTLLENCLDGGPPLRVRGDAVEVVLPPHSSAIYR